MKKITVLSLDPRGVILNGGQEVISRQNEYGEQLQSLGKFKFVIFSSSPSNFSRKAYRSVELISLGRPTFNALSFAIKANRFVKSLGMNLQLVIVGDPWESYWSAYFLRLLSGRNFKIQIQLHGDVGNFQWRKINSINRIRYYLAKLSIPYVDSVRAVSEAQKLEIHNTFKISKNKILVVPVPILNLSSLPITDGNKPNKLALIGRLHTDRGIWSFINVIEKLNAIRKDFQVVVIGSGPSEKKFLQKLTSILPSERISFLGQLSALELAKVWNQIGLLISVAPAESYGRAMREALVAGVPVWATKSSGVENLISKAGKEAVRILDLTKSSHELSKELDKLLKSKVSLSFRKQFIKDNSTYAQLLAKSWVDLINKQKR
jgi:glycosyltransferase involved in cell wall biosynthesis